MSLEALNALTDVKVDLNDPEVKARFEIARKRQRELDERLEEQVRLKEPSNELLNRSCSI